MKKFVYCENMNFYNHYHINDEYWNEYWTSYQKYRKDARYVKVGKKYEVVNTATRVDELTIKNDSGWAVTLPKSFFMDEVAYLRQKKINEILDGK
jgi:hypothetical protein